MSAAEKANSELVSLVQRGDRDAFEELLRPELGRLLRLASAIVANEADAYDVMQETLTLAWRRSSTLRDASRFRAWLTRILVNESQHALRRRGRTSVADPLVDRHSTSSPGLTLEEGVLEQDRLERAFERLAPRQKVLLVMHHLDQQPINQIGEVLRVRPGTVKSQLFSARKALAAALAEEDRDGTR